MLVLVTGGCGFIGSHVCEALLERGYGVVCVDNLDPYYDPRIKSENIAGASGDFRFINADIRDYDAFAQVVEESRPDYIIHEAAQPGVRASMENPQKTFGVNVSGTLNVLEAARYAGVRKVVYASSSSVYGEVKYLPFDEGHPTNPVSPYGTSKLAGEGLLRAYHREYGLDYVSLRYFTVYGPRIRPDLAIYRFIRAAFAGEVLGVYGDGSKSRDFTYVSDAVDATVRSLKSGLGEYNIGGGNVLTVLALAEKIVSTVGGGSVEHVEDHVGDVERTASETSRARRDLGWNPKYDFDEGLAKTIEWVRSSVAGREPEK